LRLELRVPKDGGRNTDSSSTFLVERSLWSPAKENKVQGKSIFNSPSLTEFTQERVDLAQRMLEFMPRKWVLKTIMGFSNDEVADIEDEMHESGRSTLSPGRDHGVTTTTPPGHTVAADEKGQVAKSLIEDKLRAMGREPTGDPDVDYFMHNMHNALKVPKDYLSTPKITVGPNDILVVYIETSFVPKQRIEDFLRSAKKGLKPLFEQTGIDDRVLFIAGEHKTGFQVIQVESAYSNGKKMLTKKDIAEARKILRTKKNTPPVMG
jgi:hypothetical protein